MPHVKLVRDTLRVLEPPLDERDDLVPARLRLDELGVARVEVEEALLVLLEPEEVVSFSLSTRLLVQRATLPG